jgi:hypothetical protein
MEGKTHKNPWVFNDPPKIRTGLLPARAWADYCPVCTGTNEHGEHMSPTYRAARTRAREAVHTDGGARADVIWTHAPDHKASAFPLHQG